jgi:hypothetical protein
MEDRYPSEALDACAGDGVLDSVGFASWSSTGRALPSRSSLGATAVARQQVHGNEEGIQ